VSHFIYSRTETDYLSRRDKKLGALIGHFGMLERKVTPDIFQALVECIVGQQVSNAAAATVNARLKALVGKITPRNLSVSDALAIQECGMTHKKAGYIQAAADAALDGSIDLKSFPEMDDEAIIAQLIQLPGIGRWTAEMLLLHSLQRPDVFSYDDLVIRRSLTSLHKLSTFSRADFESYRKRYSPYCSVAMIYLWKYGSEYAPSLPAH